MKLQEKPGLYPVFLNLEGRRVLVVGGGKVALDKIRALLRAGAVVQVVSPAIRPEIEELSVQCCRRSFEIADLEGVWLVVAAATPEVNHQVAVAAERRPVFVNAVDDPASASVYAASVLEREGVTLAISTAGAAPALTKLLREGLDAILPAELGVWLQHAKEARKSWKAEAVPFEKRTPELLRRLVGLYTEGVAVAGEKTK